MAPREEGQWRTTWVERALWDDDPDFQRAWARELKLLWFGPNARAGFSRPRGAWIETMQTRRISASAIVRAMGPVG